MANFLELDESNCSYEVLNKFPHDDIVVSMVAMTQLIKKLLKSYHAQQQQVNKPDHITSTSILLTRLFYLLIDVYENQMSHPNDLLNPAKSNSASPLHLTGVF